MIRLMASRFRQVFGYAHISFLTPESYFSGLSEFSLSLRGSGYILVQRWEAP